MAPTRNHPVPPRDSSLSGPWRGDRKGPSKGQTVSDCSIRSASPARDEIRVSGQPNFRAVVTDPKTGQVGRAAKRGGCYSNNGRGSAGRSQLAKRITRSPRGGIGRRAKFRFSFPQIPHLEPLGPMRSVRGSSIRFEVSKGPNWTQFLSSGGQRGGQRRPHLAARPEPCR